MGELRSAIEALRAEVMTDLPDARAEEDFAELQRTGELLEMERLRRLADLERRRAFERDGLRGGLIYFHRDAIDGGHSKARHLHRNPIGAGDYAGKHVHAGVIGKLRLHGVGLDISQLHLRFRDHGAGRIGHRSGNGSGG